MSVFAALNKIKKQGKFNIRHTIWGKFLLVNLLGKKKKKNLEGYILEKFFTP